MFLLLLPWLVGAETKQDEFTYDNALRASQAVVGQPTTAWRLRAPSGEEVALEKLRGKPVVISLVYTSCATVCSFATRNLAKAVEAARQALGRDSFAVVTVGFDVANDTPPAMGAYARRNGVAQPHWYFASGEVATVQQVMQETGFFAIPTIKGFDHLTQVTVLDADGRIYRQVYGEAFDLPMLVEPLKDLVLGRPSGQETPIEEMVRRVRLFCTIYDPAMDKYKFSYSLFLGMAIGLMIIGGGGVYMWRELRGR